MFLGIGLKLLKICSFEDDTSCFKIVYNARQIPVHIWYTQATCNESVSAFLDMGFPIHLLLSGVHTTALAPEVSPVHFLNFQG